MAVVSADVDDENVEWNEAISNIASSTRRYVEYLAGIRLDSFESSESTEDRLAHCVQARSDKFGPINSLAEFIHPSNIWLGSEFLSETVL